MNRVVFLDRDGTINKEVNYLHRPEDLVILPGVAEGIRLLNQAGYLVVVVSNQAGIARGYYTEQDCEALHRFLNEELNRSGARIDAFYYCPHHPEHGIGVYKKDCNCRKPKIGMLEQAEQDLGQIDRSHSFMIGDKRIDVEAGRRFGVRGILVGTGYGREEKEKACPQEYDFYFDTFLDAVKGGILNE